MTANNPPHHIPCQSSMYRPSSYPHTKPQSLHEKGINTIFQATLKHGFYDKSDQFLLMRTYPTFPQRCGSGIWCLFDHWIRDRFFPDSGSRIPNPYFWVKSTIILVNWQKMFLNPFRIKLLSILWYYFCLWLQKKGGTPKFFPFLSLLLDTGSKIRDG